MAEKGRAGEEGGPEKGRISRTKEVVRRKEKIAMGCSIDRTARGKCRVTIQRAG